MFPNSQHSAKKLPQYIPWISPFVSYSTWFTVLHSNVITFSAYITLQVWKDSNFYESHLLQCACDIQLHWILCNLLYVNEFRSLCNIELIKRDKMKNFNRRLVNIEESSSSDKSTVNIFSHLSFMQISFHHRRLFFSFSPCHISSYVNFHSVQNDSSKSRHLSCKWCKNSISFIN